MGAPTLRRDCPCGAGRPYDACCGRLHRGAAQAVTAEELMRSRYAAFALGDVEHLLRTWHPRTRPDSLELDAGLAWTGLSVDDVVAGGADDAEGEVAFTASWRDAAGRSGALVERSRFARRAGRWLYLDGVHD
ncbi:YchJ family metal-binding protein [Nocardioides sp. TRM66260-LWL]|uniref:YchJ family protein n=1 Tax=Nocardioides sp. TRM66260-LWL TaxID=2874478 RepID=UPI0027E04487|nr:YchJ family metal-binding protein [Nocardioides sp. TRM66260-LWL]